MYRLSRCFETYQHRAHSQTREGEENDNSHPSRRVGVGKFDPSPPPLSRKGRGENCQQQHTGVPFIITQQVQPLFMHAVMQSQQD